MHADRRPTVPLRGVTDDAGRRQPRVIRLAAGETKRLHLAVRAPANRDAYLFEVEAVSGTCHYAAEVGGGMDMFLTYFKFGIELKAAFGIPNLLVDDGTRFSTPIQSLRSKVWVLTFTFEG